jgi:hypothetical protein
MTALDTAAASTIAAHGNNVTPFTTISLGSRFQRRACHYKKTPKR